MTGMYKRAGTDPYTSNEIIGQVYWIKTRVDGLLAMCARCSITSSIVRVLKNLVTKNFPSTKPAPCGLDWSFSCLRFKQKRTPRDNIAHLGLYISRGILFLRARYSKNETHRKLASSCHQSIITSVKDVQAIGVLQSYNSKLQM